MTLLINPNIMGEELVVAIRDPGHGGVAPFPGAFEQGFSPIANMNTQMGPLAGYYSPAGFFVQIGGYGYEPPPTSFLPAPTAGTGPQQARQESLSSLFGMGSAVSKGGIVEQERVGCGEEGPGTGSSKIGTKSTSVVTAIRRGLGRCQNSGLVGRRSYAAPQAITIPPHSLC